MLLVKGKFSFLYVDIWFDVTECKFIMKNSSFKMLVAFSPIFVVDTKITFSYNFVAPLKYGYRIPLRDIFLACSRDIIITYFSLIRSVLKLHCWGFSLVIHNPFWVEHKLCLNLLVYFCIQFVDEIQARVCYPG